MHPSGYDGGRPRDCPTPPPEDDLLEPDRPAPDAARPDPDTTPPPDTDGRPDAKPLGLRGQLGATKDAARGFVQAHVDLAKAELGAIMGEVARTAALGGVAIVAAILLGLLVTIGGMLFLGEWLFGSIGWGVLLGAELLIAVAVTSLMLALRVPGLAIDIGIALVVGILVGIALALGLPNQLFTRIGEALNLGIDPAVRPLATGAVLMAILGAFVGLVLGARAKSGAAAIGGLFIGGIFGLIFGAFLSITFGPRAGAGLGVFTFLLLWPILHAARVGRQGIDMETLKQRFYPATTIDTTKESIEWAKARLPRGPKS